MRIKELHCAFTKIFVMEFRLLFLSGFTKNKKSGKLWCDSGMDTLYGLKVIFLAGKFSTQYCRKFFSSRININCCKNHRKGIILKLKLIIFWNMTPCGLINDYRYFLGMYYVCQQDSIISLTLIPRRWRQHLIPKCRFSKSEDSNFYINRLENLKSEARMLSVKEIGCEVLWWIHLAEVQWRASEHGFIII
jgi:hypothetical protein